jgi:hypothetical protein
MGSTCAAAGRPPELPRDFACSQAQPSAVAPENFRGVSVDDRDLLSRALEIVTPSGAPSPLVRDLTKSSSNRKESRMPFLPENSMTAEAAGACRGGGFALFILR